MLARKWAWEALLASDDTRPETVGQIATEVADLRNPDKTQPLDPQPALEARCSLYWLRQAAARKLPIGVRQVKGMIDLACLVDDHDKRRCMLDDDYIVVGALAPDAGLAVRVRASPRLLHQMPQSCHHNHAAPEQLQCVLQGKRWFRCILFLLNVMNDRTSAAHVPLSPGEANRCIALCVVE